MYIYIHHIFIYTHTVALRTATVLAKCQHICQNALTFQVGLPGCRSPCPRQTWASLWSPNNLEKEASVMLAPDMAGKGDSRKLWARWVHRMVHAIDHCWLVSWCFKFYFQLGLFGMMFPTYKKKRWPNHYHIGFLDCHFSQAASPQVGRARSCIWLTSSGAEAKTWAACCGLWRERHAPSRIWKGAISSDYQDIFCGNDGKLYV